MNTSRLPAVCALFDGHRQQILDNWVALARTQANIPELRELSLFREVFGDLLRSFIEHLATNDREAYYASNEKLAQRIVISSLSFRKLIMAFHAFEDACMDVLNVFPADELLLVLRELDHVHHMTIAIISEQFFAFNDWKIPAMAKLCEIRDTETSGHLERTRQYCGLLARALGQDDAYVERISWASTLHDLGKIRTPDTILLKTGHLNDEERAVMRRHTTDGARILDEILVGQRITAENYRMMRDIILYHHEKYDGSGYPYGLKGIAIPLAARIAALADAYDAITSSRPYKSPLPHSEAMGRILDAGGTHFDPLVVRAFQQVEDQFRDLRSKTLDESA